MLGLQRVHGRSARTQNVFGFSREGANSSGIQECCVINLSAALLTGHKILLKIVVPGITFPSGKSVMLVKQPGRGRSARPRSAFEIHRAEENYSSEKQACQLYNAGLVSRPDHERF